MTTKWKKAERQQTSLELEESMSQELADLGMLEHGMTFQDKQELLNVIRMSQRSAQVEEEERKTKGLSPVPQHPYTNSVDLGKENDMLCNSRLGEAIEEGDEGDINQDILSNLSMAVSDCDVPERSTLRNNQYTVPSLEYIGDVHPSTHENGSHRVKNSPNSPITLSSKGSEVGSVSGEAGGIPNGCGNEENDVLQADQEGSDNEIFPSTANKQDVNGLKRRKDDKERNIDVFSHCNGVEEHDFVRKSLGKSQERIPFYFVPEGMSMKKYIAYFKCYVNQYYQKLAVIQRNNIEHLEWGAPITMDTSGLSSFRSNSDAQGDVSKRYNFRERYTKPKLIDFTSENSEDAEEEESNDEDIFTPRHKKLPGIKLSAKRKNTSSNDSINTKKEKKECLSPVKKSQDDAEYIEDDIHIDHGQGDGPDRSGSKGSRCSMSRKRSRRIRAKPLQLQMQTQNEVPEDITEMLPPVGIESIIEPDILIAEGPAAVSIPPLLDDITNQPSPLSVKQRRLQMQGENSPRHNRRKSEPRRNPDVVLLDEEAKPPLDMTERVPCPICWRLFPATDIEEHASECNQYSPDNSSSSVRT